MSNIAVIKLAGAQHLVRPGDLLKVNKVVDDASEKITADVLLSTDGEKILFNDGKVELNVRENIKGDKIHIVKFRAKSRYRRRVGHRQQLSLVEVVSINGEVKKLKEKSEKLKVEDKEVVEAPKTKKVAVKKTVAKKATTKKGTKK